MEIVSLLLLGYIPIFVYLFWQSYLLSQYKKITDKQERTIKDLKPF